MSFERHSFIKLFTKNGMNDFVFEYFDNKLKSSCLPEGTWDGSPEYLNSFITNIKKNNDSVLIQLSVDKHDFMPDFPSIEQVNNEIKSNKKRNEDIKKQQHKDLAKANVDVPDNFIFLAYPESESKCKKEMRQYRLVENVEVCLNELLKIEGVDAGDMALRNSEIRRKSEIKALGSNDDGVFICSIDELSEDSEWIK